MAVNQQLKNAIESIKFSSKLKQSEIAERLGVKSTYLSDMINGRVPFSDSIKEKIYEVFSYNTDEELMQCSQMCYGGGEVIEMPREVFDQIAKLTETILSQQRVIESQSGVIETLVDTSKKMVARPGDNVICADASGSGIKK